MLPVSDIAQYRTRLDDPGRAAQYASRFERGSRRGIDRREQRAVQRIFSRLAGCDSVLDVPCGTGRFLANLACGRRISAIDYSAEALELARRRAADQGIAAEFLQGDASRIPLPDGAVDAIFCNRLLHHICSTAERSVFLREFHRVARKYVVTSFFDYLAFGTLRRFLKALKGRKVNYTGQPTLREFEVEVRQCGFEVIEVVPTGPFWVSEKYFVLKKPET
jgi:ubiquinone/menaquinone biosynthesis C-methylase UbiE